MSENNNNFDYLTEKTRYSKLLIFQYQKEKAIKTINLFCHCILQLIEIYKKYIDAFDLEKAQGKQLDNLGDLIGLKRLLYNGDFVDDNIYRFFLKLQIVFNYNVNTDYSISQCIFNLFENKLIFKDNRNMTIDYLFYSDDNDLINVLKQNKQILPVPAGVKTNLVINSKVDSKFFGFFNSRASVVPEIVGGFYTNNIDKDGYFFNYNNLI